jgi:outer membrane phospholipase A
MKTGVIGLVAGLIAVPLGARVDLLLVPPVGPVEANPGHQLTLYVDNPTNQEDADVRLPTTITAVYATPTTRGVVRLTVVAADPASGAVFNTASGSLVLKVPQMTSQTITLQLADALPVTEGFVSLRLTDPPTNTIMFRLVKGAGVEEKVAPAPVYAALPPKTKERVKNSAGDIDLRNDVEVVRRHILGYEPIYFVVGARERINARFQFSFKYRVLEPQPEPEVIRDLYFAYTQTSIWDLESTSKPFYDSSYKPTVFFQREKFADEGWWSHVGVQAGAQHESNGKGAGAATVALSNGLIAPPNPAKHPLDSRSLNTLYVAPRLRWASPETGWFVEASARAIAYFQMDENPDLPSYRGHVEVMVRGGHDRGFQLAMHLRGSPRRGRGSAEFNASWPVTQMPLLKWLVPVDVLRSLGGYGQIQYFNGYGESLLDYDVRRKDQLRIGLEIVR